MKPLKIEENDLNILKKALTKINFFATCGAKDYSKYLSSFDLISYDPGEKIITSGSKGNSFFIVYEGQVEIVAKSLFSSKTVAELGPGELFGEMSLLENKPRTADVVAKNACKLFILKSLDMPTLVKENPSFKEALRKLSEKRLSGN
jgi:CRP-like cAMP-binding protein